MEQCDYHLNINLQMNYWPAEVCNLAECHQPLFDLMDLLTQSGARVAKTEDGCGGWVAHHLTDPFGFATSPNKNYQFDADLRQQGFKSEPS